MLVTWRDERGEEVILSMWELINGGFGGAIYLAVFVVVRRLMYGGI